MTGYDPVAEEYAERFLNELDHKPFDRDLLDRFAQRLAGQGVVCDLGCGPGQISRYLKDRGVDAFGVDLSVSLVEIARRTHSDIPFQQADMRSLSAAKDAWAGIVAFYSLIHIPPDELPAVFRSLWRILRPDGLLLLSFHIGDGTVHLEDWWGKPVFLDFYFFTTDQMRGYLAETGFTVEGSLERPPYEHYEYPTQRAYILARKDIAL